MRSHLIKYAFITLLTHRTPYECTQQNPIHRTLFTSATCAQGWTDPMAIRAMPWGPPPKGAHLTSKNNANQQRSVTKTAQPSLDNRRNMAMK